MIARVILRGALAGLGGMMAAGLLGVTINETSSIPVGLWRQHAITGPLHIGDIIRICPPGDSQSRRYAGAGYCPNGEMPFDKPIAAVEGDTVTVGPDGISINGLSPLPNSKPLSEDGQGRRLIACPQGTYKLGPGQVWLYAGYSPRSYDSRYFCMMDGRQALGTLTPLMVWQ